MEMQIITYSIPVFFLLLGAEFLYFYKKEILINFKDVLCNLNTGILSQVFSLFFKVYAAFLYLLCFEHLNLNKIFSLGLWDSNSISTWVVAFFIVDLIYYFFHRHSHEFNLFWSAHIVHHSSEHYNLSVALRQSIFQTFFSAHYLMLGGVLGIPFEVFLVCYAINLLYQFWIHTEVIKDLGPFELVMNTPSHHRVHHSRQSEYLDKNYAGVFIIWDRFFKTFKKEQRQVIYGVYPRYKSYNALNANILPMRELFKYFSMTKGPLNKLKLLFKGPTYIFETYKKDRPYPFGVSDFSKTRLNIKAFWLFALTLGVTLAVLFSEGKVSTSVQLLLLAVILLLVHFTSRQLDSK